MLSKKNQIIAASIIFLNLSSWAEGSNKKHKENSAKPGLEIELIYEEPSAAQKEQAKSDDDEAVKSLAVKIKNTSKTNHIFCQPPVLNVLTWSITVNNQQVPNANRGHDVDRDYSPHLRPEKCYVIKAGEDITLKDEKALLEMSKKGEYFLSVDFLTKIGPMLNGHYVLTVAADNAAVTPRFDDEQALIKKLIEDNKAAQPTHFMLVHRFEIPSFKKKSK